MLLQGQGIIATIREYTQFNNIEGGRWEVGGEAEGNGRDKDLVCKEGRDCHQRKGNHNPKIVQNVNRVTFVRLQNFPIFILCIFFIGH